LQIVLLTLASVLISLLASAFVVQRVLDPHLPLAQVATYPLVSVLAQVIAYFIVFVFMVLLVKRSSDGGFWQTIRWNWPRNWISFLLAGIVLSVALQAFASMLPMPKETPMDRFFATRSEAWILSVFGVTLAPLLEELFFRGFLYPVLVRRLGVAAAIVLTSLGFSLIHAQQLGRAWGPLLIIFIVGLVLTVTRALTKSVAAGVLIHVAYNATISVVFFVATDGFRHLEKVNR
jgi:membrane protease YdiL (CAAX protease family)